MQGAREDPEWDEEPGKIVHEVRTGLTPDRERYLGLRPRDGELHYYGSADSTSWFLYLMAAVGEDDLVGELEQAWRAAGEWLLRAVERGGGLVRWHRLHEGGLQQQGWRDTVDPQGSSGGGILRWDGTVPEPPVADADTQAAAVVAMRALARLSGEGAHADAARALERRVRLAFGPETMAREAGDAEVRGAGSQLGWLLWAGCAGDDHAARLSGTDVLTPFGLRTLSDRHPAFDPHAYHRGSVWPFDSWFGWGGLRAAGRREEAERVRLGVLDALGRLGRFPELYAVTGTAVERIPIANRVQAWTVGARWALANGWDGRVGGLCDPADSG